MIHACRIRTQSMQARHARKIRAWTNLELLSSPGAQQLPTVGSANGSPSMEESRKESEASLQRGSGRSSRPGWKARLSVEFLRKAACDGIVKRDGRGPGTRAASGGPLVEEVSP